ncbi:hypothetical protein KW799_01955 [Candidatus Parcubacteria bacterium]|nr:hypothetical protein [Candidatus Parcubacteria bacterium]
MDSDGQAKKPLSDLEKIAIREPALKDMADCAYIDLLRRAGEHCRRFSRKPTSEEFNQFREDAIRANMPIRTRTCDKEAYEEVRFGIASILGKMLAESRKKKVLRKIERRGKKAKRKTKADLRAAMDRASDVLKHGTKHGEFYVPGIRARRIIPVSTYKKGSGKGWTYRKRSRKPFMPGVSGDALPLSTVSEIMAMGRRDQLARQGVQGEFPGTEPAKPKTALFGFMQDVPKDESKKARKNYRREIGV